MRRFIAGHLLLSRWNDVQDVYRKSVKGWRAVTKQVRGFARLITVACWTHFPRLMSTLEDGLGFSLGLGLVWFRLRWRFWLSGCVFVDLVDDFQLGAVLLIIAEASIVAVLNYRLRLATGDQHHRMRRQQILSFIDRDPVVIDQRGGADDRKNLPGSPLQSARTAARGPTHDRSRRGHGNRQSPALRH